MKRMNFAFTYFSPTECQFLEYVLTVHVGIFCINLRESHDGGLPSIILNPSWKEKIMAQFKAMQKYMH